MGYPGTDPLLVAAAARGEEKALDRLVDECLPAVLGWCARLGGPKVDAEDAAHDVMMVVMTRIDRLTRPESFPYWIFGICRNVLRSHRRRAWVMRGVPGEPPDQPDRRPLPDRAAEISETARRVHAVLARLPAAQREALVLCDMEERSSGEAARLLDVPQGTVKSRLRLARKRFRVEAATLGLAADLEAVVGVAT
jgi:RNA polymerase sigma-70 factor (ECF subfamily)